MARSIVLQTNEMKMSRSVLEELLPPNTEWRTLVFVGAVQHEQYLISDGSVLSVIAAPREPGCRNAADQIIKLEMR